MYSPGQFKQEWSLQHHLLFYQHVFIALYDISIKRKTAQRASYRDKFYVRQLTNFGKRGNGADILRSSLNCQRLYVRSPVNLRTPSPCKEGPLML